MSERKQPTESSVESRTRTERIRSGTLGEDTLHLLVFSGMVVAQPLLDLLSRQPEFFVVRGFDRAGIVALVVALLVVPALPFVLLELVFRVLRKGAHQWLHRSFVALFLCTFSLLALKSLSILPATAAAATALLLGISATVVYDRVRIARAFVDVLAIAIVAIPLVFFLNPSVSKLMSSRRPTPAGPISISGTSPIVFIVFDEFCLPVLVDEQGMINQNRYPNLAALASNSSWYSNATTVAEFTTAAVPAILTGLWPPGGKLPNVHDHPRNLFTILGTSYNMWVREPLTQMCPPHLNTREATPHHLSTQVSTLTEDLLVVFGHRVLPAEWAQRLPSISNTWSNFGDTPGPRTTTGSVSSDALEYHRVAVEATHADRRIELEAFLDALDNGSKSCLYFLHVMLPHCPWNLLPSGQLYPAEAGVWGVVDNDWCDDEYLTQQSLQRYILQVMYLDGFIGRLVQRLKNLGFFDEAIIVLTADHGTSFTPGKPRRFVSYETAHEIVPVPLLIKRPHQQEGVVVHDMVSTIDILPTLLDLLDAHISWPLDGVSLVDDKHLKNRQFKFRAYGKFHELRSEHLNARPRFIESMLHTFGDGTDPSTIYRFGTYAGLVGRPTAEFELERPASWKLKIQDSDLFQNVDLQGPILPAFVQGSFSPKPDRAGCYHLAVAVNGIVQATTRTHNDSGKLRLFTVMLPPTEFTNGVNDVEVYVIESHQGSIDLRRILGA
jgi:hypothetical protein